MELGKALERVWVHASAIRLIFSPIFGRELDTPKLARCDGVGLSEVLGPGKETAWLGRARVCA